MGPFNNKAVVPTIDEFNRVAESIVPGSSTDAVLHVISTDGTIGTERPIDQTPSSERSAVPDSRHRSPIDPDDYEL